LRCHGRIRNVVPVLFAHVPIVLWCGTTSEFQSQIPKKRFDDAYFEHLIEFHALFDVQESKDDVLATEKVRDLKKRILSGMSVPYSECGAAIDACQRCYKQEVVFEAYISTRNAGYLSNFGVYSERLRETPKAFVTTAQLNAAGVPVQSLSPQPSQRPLDQIAITAFAGLVLLSGLERYALSVAMSPNLRPFVTFLLSFAVIDRLAFSGALSDEAGLRLNGPYRQRVIRHEAAHFLIAYLLGCPIRSVACHDLL